MEKEKNNLHTTRPPVVAVMGHIDHGKSTLLDYIRKASTCAGEAGGITQRMSAYKMCRKSKDGKDNFITFLDTPGHEAFKDLRSRGASVADIAILVVAADEGVKPQTIEAIKCIKSANLPFIVAMNKIDRPNADIEKLKINLSENEIFVEGFGGDVPAVPVSALTGTGVEELLDMVLLVSELADLKADYSARAEGIIIETKNDKSRGISTTLIVKNGTLKSGDFIVSEGSLAPTRIMENYEGEKITEATPSDPVRIVGWQSTPAVGSIFTVFDSKKEAEVETLLFRNEEKNQNESIEIGGGASETITIPVIIKASTTDVIEAVLHEIRKIKNERVILKILTTGVGFISEKDVKLASSKPGSVILGFETKTDASAKVLAERDNIKIVSFDIIYKITEWLQNFITEQAPRIKSEEERGKAKILRFFSRIKDKQVVGARIESGSIGVGDDVKIMRRDQEVGRGKVKGLQQSKVEVKEVKEGSECGALIEAKLEMAPGDKIESFIQVEK